MPIYAYKCASCGYAKDVLQKLSDAPLTVCPRCGQPVFQKQVTAASFQLKGSGWYVTDFRDGSGNSADPAAPSGDDGKAPSKPNQAQDNGVKAETKIEARFESSSESPGGAATSSAAPAVLPPPPSATPGGPASSDGSSG